MQVKWEWSTITQEIKLFSYNILQGLQLKLHLKLFIYVFSECIDLMFAELPYKDFYYQESLFLFQHSRCFSPDFLHNCPILSGILSLFHHFLVSIFLLPLISLIFPAVYITHLVHCILRDNKETNNVRRWWDWMYIYFFCEITQRVYILSLSLPFQNLSYLFLFVYSSKQWFNEKAKILNEP